MNRPPDFAPRIVRPRVPTVEDRPLIIVTRDIVLVESMNDDVFSAEELPTILAGHAPAIVVTQGFGAHLQRLQRAFEHDPLFNYRLTPIYRYARPWNDGRKVEQGMMVDAVCNYVGWRNEDPKAKRANRYHYPLDPIWFLTAGIDQLDDSSRPRVVKLYEWAKQVRQWCADNELKVKASAGALAAALLKDPRFFPEPRRKVPRFINDIARERLPGNYYSLRADEGEYYSALYLDMENAHHAMASDLDFPSANSLHAFGDWSHTARETRREATYSPNRPPILPRAFAPGDSLLLRRSGLFHVRIQVPHIPRNFFPPPYMATAGMHDVYVYSNELELIKSVGGIVTDVHAAYISEETDHGLNDYARYAIEQIKLYPSYKPWLKPTLHATYGLLAARPNKFETGFLRAKGGVPTEYHMGNVSLPVLAKRRNAEIEANIANVIHRGMIEAEVRKRTLMFARELTADGHNVLAIYADALFLEDNGTPLRLLPPPWRLSKAVRDLRFHSPTHFTSSQFSRLPGVPRTARESLIRSRELGHVLNHGRTLRRLPPDIRNRIEVLSAPGGAQDGMLTKTPDRPRPRAHSVRGNR